MKKNRPTVLAASLFAIFAGATLSGCTSLHTSKASTPTDASADEASHSAGSGGDATGANNDVVANVAAPANDTELESAADVWDRLRRGMVLGNHDHPGIAGELAWFSSHQAYLDRTVERAYPYMHLIVSEVERRGLPAELALLPVVESAFQPFAYSHGRAAGIWQFIPGTGKRFGLQQTWWYDGRRDIARSTRAALDYLEFLNKEFSGDWLLALAAYNSGEGTVHRAVRENRRKGKGTDFWSLNLPRETRGYVPKLLAISAIVAEPAAHGIVLKGIPDQPMVAEVDVGSQIDLDLAAELAEISIEEMYRLNPAFNRWATDPDGPHTLLVPLEKAELFQQRVAELPREQRIEWVRHDVRNGETLSTIANRYGISVALVSKVNDLKGNSIRAGSFLMIPMARQDATRYSLSQEQRLAATQETPRGGDKREYMVRQGDTLWSIAKAHNVSVEKLAQWNSMAPRDTLRAGQKLVVWGQQPEQADMGTVIPTTFRHPHSDALERRIGYTVRRGDSLAVISKKFNVSVEDVKRWNKLRKTNLRPGQQLTLYVDVTKQSGKI